MHRDRHLQLSAVLLAVTLCVVDGFVTPTDTYTHNAALDDFGKVHLFWKYDDTTITFEVHAETLGYVGFGISPNGGMTNSDIVIGWVKDGNTYLKDRFASAEGEPGIDDQQDYELIGGMETETHTVLTFSRKIDTCDEKDRVVTSDTLRLIYAYHADDPDTETGLPYHGAEQRGARSVHVLGVAPAEPEMPTGDDLLIYEFLNPNVTIPHHQDTTYWCQAFKIPPLDKKHHMIKYEPIIQEGHEALVHHILIYQCRSGVDEGYHGFGHECYSPNMPANLTQCSSTIVAWAIGGGAFYLPENAGFSLGDIANGDPDFVVMETHYDNPLYKDTFIDSSGIRVYYTPILRENDAAILEIGNGVSAFGQFIPPGASDFTTYGYCSQECLQEGSADTSITVFASVLHSHLAGVKLLTRHFRGGVELPMIAEDNSYDFNLQEMRHLKESVVIQPGDRLLTECTYNTMDRSTMTFGGLSTKEEMCLHFLYYYPRIQLPRCESNGILDLAMQACCNVTKIDYETIPLTVLEPPQYAGQRVIDVLNAQEWTQEQLDDFETAAYQLAYQNVCEKSNTENHPSHYTFKSVPEVTEPLVPEVSECESSADSNKYQWTSFVMTFPILLAMLVFM
ncbi:DBH-like monooxygenase protein 1 homolog [Ptychodera flava]|uniref:DBH-like monooxygenase protein 1 homolog n=1 Tax=Ptychodera flava TaxID=63121 RepID=UPI003969ED29